jgi:hypothetical protein
MTELCDYNGDKVKETNFFITGQPVNTNAHKSQFPIFTSTLFRYVYH